MTSRSVRWKLGAAAMAGAVMLAGVAAGADTVEALQAAAKRPPKDPQQALELGHKLRRAGLFAEAARVTRGAALRAGSKHDLAVALRLEAARSYIDAREQKPALRECAALRKLSPPKSQVCEAEAQLLWRRASLALPAAEKALSSDANDYDALVAKGRALLEMSSPQPAEAALRAAIGADAARWEAHRFLADLLQRAGRRSAAVAELRKAVQLAPDEPEPALLLAELLPAGTEAEGLLKRAVAERPGYAAAYARLGEVLLDQRKLAPAEQALRRAIALDATQADPHALLARLLLDKGDPAAALKESAAALKIVKNHAGAKLVEADALAKRGDIDLAIEAYSLARGFARSDPAPLVHAARACLDGARPTTALAFAEQATQTFPDWGPAWEVFGDVQLAAGDKAAARRAYGKALAAKGPVDKARLRQKLASVK